MPKIKIYSTRSCHSCQLAKDYFNKNNIDYEEVDVTGDTEALEYILDKTGQMSVPVIEIGYTIIPGWSQKLVESALSSAMA